MQNHAGPDLDSGRKGLPDERACAPGQALSLHFTEPQLVPPDRSSLAAFCFDPPRNALRPGPGLIVDVPLAPAAPGLAEVWSVPGPVEAGEIDGLPVARARGVVFGALSVPAQRAGELEDAAFTGYARILRATRGLHLYRFWNTVPRINADENDLERYKLFCRGRSFAFERHFGERFPAHLPAASAVGSRGGDLVIAFMAGEDEPQHRENPRQVAAWAYPESYGPRSPSFARATCLPSSLGGAVLLSGTASVVGHESAHPGDTAAQVDETVRNLDALLSAAVDPADPRRSVTMLKAFVRHREDFVLVREALSRAYGPHVPVLVLQADICRAELLVEIEGLASI